MIRTSAVALNNATPTLLSGTTDRDGNATVVVVNSDAAILVYVGGSDVTTANGIELVAGGGSLIIDVAPSDDVYAIAASGTPSVRVLTTRKTA